MLKSVWAGATAVMLTGAALLLAIGHANAGAGVQAKVEAIRRRRN